MEKYWSTCKFCGQVLACDEDFENEEQAQEYASRHCECEDSKRYNRVESSKEKAINFLTEFNENQIAVICKAIADVGYDVIDTITLKIDSKHTDSQHTIKIKLDSYGRVVCDLKKSEKERIEL